MSWFSGLTGRERLMILVVLPLALLLGGYRFGWLPLQQLRADRDAEIANYRLIAAAAAGANPGDALAALPIDAAPIATRVTASANAAGIALRRLEPEGERVRVTLDDTDFAALTLWISDLETDQAITVAAIELDRRIVPGSVSAQLTLEAAR